MRKKVFIIGMTVITIMVFMSVQTAMAGRGCQSQTSEDGPQQYIDVDKTAPGTKYDATLVIYYTDVSSCAITPITPNTWNLRDMHFFMRIKANIRQGGGDNWLAGQEILPFDGVAECVAYYSDDYINELDAIEDQQDALEDFFRLEVNPLIYEWNNPEDPNGCEPDAIDPLEQCPEFALKNASDIVEDFPWDDGPEYVIMDLVIAIED